MTKTSNSSEQLLARAYALSNDDETKGLYKDWAQTYDATMLDGLAYLTPKKTADLLSGIVPNKELHILDVGAATGLAGQYLAELGFKSIDALDFSSAMLDVAKAREHDSKPVYKSCIQADLNLPLDLNSDTYGAIICTGLFTHAHVGAGCLPELFRILKPGSFFATTVHKDIWKSEGFEVQIKSLEQAGVMKTYSKELDTFFKTDNEPQGYYILWECLK